MIRPEIILAGSNNKTNININSNNNHINIINKEIRIFMNA